MDLWQLEIFVTVIDKKSFSKASETVNLSQPTVSSHIKELEAHFNCRLLDRLGKVTEPTKAGQLLYRYAKKLLSLRDHTESAMLDFLGNSKGKLLIGGSTIPTGYILPRIIGGFTKKYPEVSVSISAGDTSQIIQHVISGEIETGIVGARVNDPRIQQEILVHDQMKLIVPQDHKWANKQSINCSSLLKERLIAREGGSGTWQSVLKSLDSAGFHSSDLKTCITMGSSIAVIQGIINHIGISILSTIAVEDELKKGRLKALSVKGIDLDRHFFLTVSQKRTLSPICKKFIDFAKARI
ncbi:MAG: LysR family transcriptional regulator [Desulfobacteraceae bacterium]|nr:LysR family transcriptional regulator [Desulfobacteraceae bacterium]